MSGIERRKAKRAEANFDVNYIHGGDYLISRTKDISVDGMFLYTKRPPALHDQTKLSFSLDGRQTVEVKAEVVWVNSNSTSKDSGMAVKFLKPSKQLQKDILKIINKIAVLPD